MRIIGTAILAFAVPLLLVVACSDDPPTSSSVQQQVFLADTSAHLATDILTFRGGTGADWGTSIVEIPDNALAAAGSTDSYGKGKNSLYIVKTDSTGKVMWQRVFGGYGDDNAEKMALTPDDHLIVAGVTSSFSGSYDVYLLKVSLDGSLAWQKSIGSDDFEWGTDLTVLSDGYAVCGYSIPSDGTDGGNFILVRTDLNGNETWTKTYDRLDREWSYALTATSDGGFVMAGLVHYHQASDIDIYLIKTDDTGGVVWENTYGGDGDDKAFAIIETNDAGYVVAGTSRSFSSDNFSMVYVFKVDINGAVVWERSFGDGGYLQAKDIMENPDGSLILTGATVLDGTGTGIAKLDASGNLLWNDDIGIAATGTSVIRQVNGKYAVTGFAVDTVVTGVPDVLLMRVTER